jgi:prepilin-type N-terminal cleavage/methylation domain-containing protein
MFQKIRNNKAFTLIELMATIAIILILFAIAIPKILNIRERWNEATTELQIEETIEPKTEEPRGNNL